MDGKDNKKDEKNTIKTIQTLTMGVMNSSRKGNRKRSGQL